MDNVIKNVLSLGYLLIEKAKGLKVFEKDLHHISTSNLKVVSIANHSVTIFVTKTYWVERYKVWFVPNKHHSVYRVYSRAEDNAPEYLFKACKTELSVPALHPWFVPERKQMEAVVAAYVDVLVNQVSQLRF